MLDSFVNLKSSNGGIGCKNVKFHALHFESDSSFFDAVNGLAKLCEKTAAKFAADTKTPGNFCWAVGNQRPVFVPGGLFRPASYHVFADMVVKVGEPK